ncbi:hypothetical protein OEZ60_13950 [Defluviimonas sp. WL0024]|uniref:Uncharacterized protein n=1 Tax=Albidovulum salinarum TaxID=2984153 RepID=A0ABT2X587_9RHOB|nr:hypothetical protein [Defluviimonas sp. WL0024]MCU9849105.1 hypothetical protein [Defluviimonas sp. WL0024]
MSNYVPLLVTIIGAIVAGITYVVQKKIDRGETLLREKKEAYRSYLAALTDVSRDALYASIDDAHMRVLNETNARASHAYDSVQLYASEQVLRTAAAVETALLDWRLSLSEEQKHGDADARKNFLIKRSELIKEMRIELFGDESVDLATSASLQRMLWNGAK